MHWPRGRFPTWKIFFLERNAPGSRWNQKWLGDARRRLATGHALARGQPAYGCFAGPGDPSHRMILPIPLIRMRPPLNPPGRAAASAGGERSDRAPDWPGAGAAWKDWLGRARQSEKRYLYKEAGRRCHGRRLLRGGKWPSREEDSCARADAGWREETRCASRGFPRAEERPHWIPGGSMAPDLPFLNKSACK